MEIYRDLVPWMKTTRGEICTFEQDPALWSEDTIAETLRRHGSSVSGVQDLRSFVRSYLNVVCGLTRKAESF